MPVPATRLADVVAGDPHPLVLGRGSKHAPQQLTIAGLQLTLPLERLTRFGDPIGKRIAHPLQLFEAHHPGLAKARRNPSIEVESRKGLDGKTGELVLEASDLAAQLGAREALVASNANFGVRVSIEQLRHGPRVSVDHLADSKSEDSVKRERRSVNG